MPRKGSKKKGSSKKKKKSGGYGGIRGAVNPKVLSADQKASRTAIKSIMQKRNVEVMNAYLNAGGRGAKTYAKFFVHKAKYPKKEMPKSWYSQKNVDGLEGILKRARSVNRKKKRKASGKTRPASPYFNFMNALRPSRPAKLNQFGGFSRFVSERWREMTADEKAVFGRIRTKKVDGVWTVRKGSGFDVTAQQRENDKKEALNMIQGASDILRKLDASDIDSYNLS